MQRPNVIMRLDARADLGGTPWQLTLRVTPPEGEPLEQHCLIDDLDQLKVPFVRVIAKELQHMAYALERWSDEHDEQPTQG